MRQKLNLITLGVNDLEKSLAFYEKGLGWKKSSSSNENIAFFALGGIVLGLYGRKLLAEDITISEKGNGFGGITVSFNAKSEKEVDDVMKRSSSAWRHNFKTRAKGILGWIQWLF